MGLKEIARLQCVQRGEKHMKMPKITAKFGRKVVVTVRSLLDEKIVMWVYLSLLPYIVGTLFLFFYILNTTFDIFYEVNNDLSLLLNWYIGFEVLALVALLMIFKNISRVDTVESYNTFKGEM